MILVKNLPAGTKSEELRDLFSKHGTVGRVVLPPSGVTAIVEYLEPSEAKAGFRRLAYTKVWPENSVFVIFKPTWASCYYTAQVCKLHLLLSQKVILNMDVA